MVRIQLKTAITPIGHKKLTVSDARQFQQNLQRIGTPNGTNEPKAKEWINDGAEECTPIP